ncbi:hypothetical protein BC833DRAFT_540155 [Globomyces pollinis-pini]|nr:hypothetical protein BC833DRAFT_540155 [Globomyces pollinis-pini]
MEKSLMDELFPKGNIILDQPELASNSVLLHRSLTNSKLEESIASIYAAMESDDLEYAEVVFHKIWRSNRAELQNKINPKMIERFIDLFLEKQKQNMLILDYYPRAMEWFDNMESEYNVKRTISIYACVISYYLETSQIQQAKDCIKSLEADGLQLDELLQTTYFFEEHQVNPLRITLQSMGKNIQKPNSDIDNLLLSALEDSHQISDDKPTESALEDLTGIKTLGVSILRKTLEGKKNTVNMPKYSQQLWLEQRAYTAAQELFEASQENIPQEMRRVCKLPPDLIQTWHDDLTVEIEASIKSGELDPQYMPFMKLLPPAIMTRIVFAEILRTKQLTDDVTKFGQMRFLNLVMQIGKAIEREHNLTQLNQKKNLKLVNLDRSVHKIHSSGKLLSMTLRKAITEFSKNEHKRSDKWKPHWGDRALIQIGTLLVEKCIKVTKVPIRVPATDVANTFNTEIVPAFKHDKMYIGPKCVGIIVIHPALNDLILNNVADVAPWSLPMLVPPLPWLSPNSGGYLQHRFSMVRHKNSMEHKSYIHAAAEAGHLVTAMRSLDALGAVPWKINAAIYKVAAYFWNSNISVPGIPVLLDDIPEIEKPEDYETNYKAKYGYKSAILKRKQTIQNAFSERCSTNYKLDIARAFIDETIYFPHNLDFRGRAYPMPAHFNHIGNDLSRGLLLFAEARPLGAKGLRWLKIQVSNLFGNDKVSLDDREKFTEAHIENVLDSARNPIDGDQWWLKGDNPWQLLATCIELEKALSVPDPTKFESRMPIHQDGSCNGLQHYAALGGDIEGARQVNLIPSDKPGDVYTAVAKGVQKRVDDDVLKNIPEAILMQSRINRKVVKQTVMTNTYGVTRIGAREQIYSRLKEARVNEDPSTALTDPQMRKCAQYLTGLVFESMADLFNGAREIQLWLTNAAKLVSGSVPESQFTAEELQLYDDMIEIGVIESPEKLAKINEAEIDDILAAAQADAKASNSLNITDEVDPELQDREIIKLGQKPNRSKVPKLTSMTWTTPLGLPIVQPYRKMPLEHVKTFMQSFTVSDTTKVAPVNTSKQSSAFPPNFVHSLDASHMMLTSIGCQAKGITFASVHDSFWTHACDVDNMSSILRDSFIRLHSKSIIERLRDEMMTRFGKHRIQVTVELGAADKKRLIQLRQKRLAPGEKATTRISSKLTVWSKFALPPIPKKGNLDIETVRDSTYFFH